MTNQKQLNRYCAKVKNYKIIKSIYYFKFIEIN